MLLMGCTGCGEMLVTVRDRASMLALCLQDGWLLAAIIAALLDLGLTSGLHCPPVE